MMDTAFITPELFRFLRELRAHNERTWFEANKSRYLSQVRDPVLSFVAAVGPKLLTISPHVVADPRPSGGSLLRIYRDTRFSRDKTLYKTNVGLRFPHGAGKDVHGPGYYLHLEPGEVFMGAGIWHPDAAALHAVREAIVKNPRAWKRAQRSPLTHTDESLRRTPRGFDPDHPLVDDLKRTSFTVGQRFTEKQACSPRFLEVFVGACRREAPLMKFLASALGLPF